MNDFEIDDIHKLKYGDKPIINEQCHYISKAHIYHYQKSVLEHFQNKRYKIIRYESGYWKLKRVTKKGVKLVVNKKGIWKMYIKRKKDGEIVKKRVVILDRFNQQERKYPFHCEENGYLCLIRIGSTISRSEDGYLMVQDDLGIMVHYQVMLDRYSAVLDSVQEFDENQKKEWLDKDEWKARNGIYDYEPYRPEPLSRYYR